MTPLVLNQLHITNKNSGGELRSSLEKKKKQRRLHFESTTPYCVIEHKCVGLTQAHPNYTSDKKFSTKINTK